MKTQVNLVAKQFISNTKLGYVNTCDTNFARIISDKQHSQTTSLNKSQSLDFH